MFIFTDWTGGTRQWGGSNRGHYDRIGYLRIAIGSLGKN